MSIIEVKNLTKDYGHGRGVFNVTINIEKGQCFGFLGPNGAGKTTTIRHLMGFSRAQEGSCSILGKDCWNYSAELKEQLGYLPGEIVFPTGMTGSKFLEMMKRLRHLKDDTYCKSLLGFFELDPNMDLNQMSLGTKRKLAVVTAFMHDPDILILDEPTSGLDPILQEKFISYIISEKKRGKTILLSSHIFHEVDAACDKIAIIKDGHIISQVDENQLHENAGTIYELTFNSKEDFENFEKRDLKFVYKNTDKKVMRIMIEPEELKKFISIVAQYELDDFCEIPFTLESYFMKFYKEQHLFGEVK